MKQILMIVGSLRKRSFNLQLAKQVETMLAGKAQVRFLAHGDIPYMNQDIEWPTPQSIAHVRQAVQEAEGIWIFTPEYNYQIPGVLKNLLDWLSRPLIPNDWQTGSVVKGKPVTISGVAGKSGAAGVRKHLSTLLQGMSMKVVGGMGTGVSLDGEAFRTEELILSEENKKELQAQMEAFLETLSE